MEKRRLVKGEGQQRILPIAVVKDEEEGAPRIARDDGGTGEMGQMLRSNS
jgi:hypothetical protein